MRRKNASVECNFEIRLTHLLFEIDDQYRKWESELVITSGSEMSAYHSRTSLHYCGCAFDLRIWRTHKEPTALKQANKVREIARAYCVKLGIPVDWIDVVLEDDHIHVEIQPKRIADAIK